MKQYSLVELYTLYFEFKKGKPLFEPVSVIEFFNWLVDKETNLDEGRSPFDSINDAACDYSEDGR